MKSGETTMSEKFEFESAAGDEIEVEILSDDMGIWIRTENGRKHMTPKELMNIAEKEDVKDKILLG